MEKEDIPMQEQEPELDELLPAPEVAASTIGNVTDRPPNFIARTIGRIPLLNIKHPSDWM